VEKSGGLHDLHHSLDIIWVIIFKKNEVGGTCGMYGERRDTYRLWWVDNIKMAV
jgi:hypothetical protein